MPTRRRVIGLFSGGFGDETACPFVAVDCRGGFVGRAACELAMGQDLLIELGLSLRLQCRAIVPHTDVALQAEAEILSSIVRG